MKYISYLDYVCFIYSGYNTQSYSEGCLMLENMSIKKLLFTVPVVIVFSFGYLYYAVSSNLDELDDKSQKTSLSSNIVKQMLDARVSEKNYVLSKDLHYAQELVRDIQKTLEVAKELKEMFNDPQNDKLVEDVQTNIKQYLTLFKEYQKVREQSLQMQQKMVKEANDVETIAIKVRAIQKKQVNKIIKSSSEIKVIVDEIEEASLANKIVKELMAMRIDEKNYISRKDLKYKASVEGSIKEITKLSLYVKDILDSPKNKKMMDDIIKALQEYKKAFDTFSALRDKSLQTASKMKKEAQESEVALVNLQNDQKTEKIELMKQLKVEMIIIFLVSGLGIALYVLFISNLVAQNLKIINDAAKNLAIGDGDLTKRIEIEGDNEVASVAKSINEFIEKVQSAISETKHVSSEAASISNELSATSLEIGRNVESEAELVKSINSETIKTTEEAEFVGNTVTQMHTISDKSFHSLSQTTRKINALIETVKDSSVKEEELALKMQELKESTNDVKSILELIGDIAEQTNLLSLNAAIEAARAGDHGRGFAVVADEVRKLAERTQKSLTEINATINVVTQAVDEASDNMQENAQDISAAAEQASDVEESVDGVMNAIEHSKQMALESSEAVNKLQARVVDISKNMSQLNDTATLNARSVEEIAAAAEHQNEIIEELNKQLSSFKS